MSCRWIFLFLLQNFVTFLKDLTIQVDPNATGVLKLPNLLDMMSRIVDVENHDGQIMDAFKWDTLLRYIYPRKMLQNVRNLKNITFAKHLFAEL